MTVTRVIIETLQPSFDGRGHFRAINPDIPGPIGLGNTPEQALGDLMLWHARNGLFTIKFNPKVSPKPADTEV
jgi:hypothetical protein